MIQRVSGLLPALVVACLAVLLAGGCASLAGRDPLQVAVAGIEPLPGEGLELRLLVKLRVQNPNDQVVDFNGVALQLDVQGSRFATGVSEATGTLPRFGETVLEVPVTVSAISVARQVMGVMGGAPADKFRYELRGKLSGSGIGAQRFQSEGVLDLTGPGAALAP